MTHLRKMMLEELSFLSMLICWHNQKVYGGFLPKNQKVGGSTPLGRATFTKTMVSRNRDGRAAYGYALGRPKRTR